MSGRLLKLDLVVRLRRLGWWPWALLVGWTLFAITQEPPLLRPFGMELCVQATWSGAAVVLACLAVLGAPATTSHIRYNVYTAIALTSIVGLVQAAVALLADALFSVGHSLGEAARSWMLFVLVWTPACLGLVFDIPAAPRSSLLLLVRTLPVVFSLLIATTWRDGLSLREAAANVLITVGVILAMTRWSRTSAVATPCA